jgi:hypothetical protein
MSLVDSRDRDRVRRSFAKKRWRSSPVILLEVWPDKPQGYLDEIMTEVSRLHRLLPAPWR